MVREKLTEAEETLIAAVARGEEANLGRDVDPRGAMQMSDWSQSRTIRAHILDQLLRDESPAQGAAVHLTGARIVGPLRLEYGRLHRPLRLDLCWFDEAVSLLDLSTKGIEFTRCRVPAMRANAVDVQGGLSAVECAISSVVMQDSRVSRSLSFADSRLIGATTPLHVRNLEVGGSLLLSRARIFSRDQSAVDAEGLHVASGLALEGSRVRGRVSVPGARVGGAVDFTRAVLRNGDQVALQAQHLHARGVSLRGCQITGAVDVRHAALDGTMLGDGAVIANPGGQALYASDITADRLHFGDGTRIYGRMSFHRASLRGAVALQGIQIRNAGGQAIRASGAEIGALAMDNADIEGKLVCDEIKATSIHLTGARIANPGDPSSVTFQSAIIRRDLDCRGLVCEGTLNIKGVRVAGAVMLNDARLTCPGQTALAGSTCMVGERFSCDGDTLVKGDLDLAHADIGKSVVMDLARIEGTVRLFQARVRSDVLMRGTYIESEGYGVDGIGLQVDGRFTGRGLVCDGRVRLTALVADTLVLSGAQLYNPGGNALIAARAEVRGDLVLGQDPYNSRDPAAMQANGGVVLRDSRVGGDVVFDNTDLCHPGRRALDATSIEIGGKFSLERIGVDGTVALDKSQVRRRVVIKDADLRGYGVGSPDGMIAISALQVSTDEVLVDGGRIQGLVRLTGSRVSVGLSFRGAAFSAPGGVAIAASDLECGEAHLSELDVSGSIALVSGKVSGDVLIERSSFRHPGRRAIDLSRVSIAGALVVTESELAGALVTHRAEIGLAMELGSVSITLGASQDDYYAGEASQAIDAAGVRVEGSIECNDLTTDGQVSFAEAYVTGRVIFRRGCALTATYRAAMYAPGIRVLGSLEFGWGRSPEPVDVRVSGDIRLDRAWLGEAKFQHMEFGGVGSANGVRPRITLREAQIDRRLAMDDLLIADGGAAIDLSKVRAGILELPQGDVQIDLRDADVRTLELDPSDTTTVSLSGLSFDDPGSADVNMALEWFRRDPTGFQHQAYEQLAAHYRRQGNEGSARKVLLRRQRHRRDLLKANRPGQLLMKLWGYVQDATVGYGYRPGLAAFWFAGLLAIGTLYFNFNQDFEPVEDWVHPTFNSFGYTLDLLIPLFSFGQDLAWDPLGGDLVMAYGLVFAGGLLATTIAAAVTRVLARR
jgi:uncharacterized protein YjbI with pentapeptide repeats